MAKRKKHKFRASKELPHRASLGTEHLTSITLVQRVRSGPDTGKEGTTLQLQIRSDRRREWTIQIPPAQLLDPKKVLAAAIDHSGLFPGHDLLPEINAMRDADVPEIIETRISGWKGQGSAREFVLPGLTITRGNKRAQNTMPVGLLTHPDEAHSVGRASGTLTEWQGHNARVLGYSTFGIACLGATMAALLVRLAGLPESLVILLSGPTSGGKSAVQTALMSFQGEGREAYLVGPAYSDRAVLELGANHNDLMLGIDDLTGLQPRARRELMRGLIYGTVAGHGRTVSKSMQSTWPQLSFSTVVITSSELGADEIARQAGDERLGGEDVRVFDLIAADPDDGGVFDLIPPEVSARDAADDLKKYSARYYGTPLVAFVKWLLEQPEKSIRKRVAALTAAFEEGVTTEAGLLKGKSSRIVRKFGLLYAALMLGREAGVIPWKAGRIRKSIEQCFERATRSDRLKNDELLAAFKRYLADPAYVHILRRADKKRAKLPTRNPDWLFLKGIERGGEQLWGVYPPMLKKLFGSDAARLVMILERSKAIETGKGKERWQQRVPGFGKPRLYLLHADRLDGAAQQAA